MVGVCVATIQPGNRFKRSCHGWRCRCLFGCGRRRWFHVIARRAWRHSRQAATLVQTGLCLLQSHRRALSKCQKCQGLHPVSRSGIGRDLHRLRVCGHVIVGYNVAIGGDEEAGTFADDHTLRLPAVGKKNLKDHQMRDAPITTKSTPSDAWDQSCASKPSST